ncbi:hypothetical protein BurJ1DRAFT_1674 [Burkholderiales bacterium JOSHI_001]|nr:hypothetical protein BurJ1DRAFT_1674 [Burkholderiales bacterium JOSHI_001]
MVDKTAAAGSNANPTRPDPPPPVASPVQATQTAQAQSAQKVDDTVADIRNKLKDGGWLEDDLTHDELKDIAKTLEGLSPQEANQVLSKLTDAEINKIADEIDSSGIGNYDGLSKDQKHDLIASLAGKLDAKQFERVAKAFDDPKEIGDIVAAQGSNDAKIGFINAHKGDASSGPQVGGWLDSMSGVTRYGNDSARAIATVLGSMDAAGLERAIGKTNSQGEFEAGALSAQQLREVFDAAVDQTAYSGPPGTGGGVPSYGYNVEQLNRIVDAVSRSGDAGLKTEVFMAASQSLGKIQDVAGSLLTPSANANQQASSLSDHLGGLLKSDPRGIVDRLERADSFGDALTRYTRQQLADGKTADLHDILVELRNGPNGDARSYLSDTEHAEDLGYALGAVSAGLDSLKKSNKEKADLLGGLIESVVGNLPYGGDAISFASQKALDATLGEVSAGAKEAPQALYDLIVKGLSASVQGDIDTTMDRVLIQQHVK